MIARRLRNCGRFDEKRHLVHIFLTFKHGQDVTLVIVKIVGVPSSVRFRECSQGIQHHERANSAHSLGDN